MKASEKLLDPSRHPEAVGLHVPAPPASVLEQKLLQRVDLGAALERPQAKQDFGHELPVRSDRLRLVPSLVLVGADENGGLAAIPGYHELFFRFHYLIQQ